MSRLIRREAMTLFAGAGVGAVLGMTSGMGHASNLAPQHSAGAALLQGTLTPDHIKGRRMAGFLETGISDGHVMCSLVRQDERNPAVQSVFAAPSLRDGVAGVEITVSFFTEPVGDITFSLLHVSDLSAPTAERKAALQTPVSVT